MVFPVVERELLVASRRPGTYATRAVAAGFAMCALVWNIIYYSTHDGTTAQQSRDLFGAFTVVAFVFCALIGVVTTADCISEEKREGTLGLLFLTDLKGHDIVFGKIVAGSVNVVYGLLATLPIAALALVMGGVSLVQFVAVAIVLVTTMGLSLAIGVLVSTGQQDERRAMLYTAFLIIIFMVFPLGACGGPLYAFGQCMLSLHGNRRLGVDVALSGVWTSFLALMLITSASFRVPKSGETPATNDESTRPAKEIRLSLWKPTKRFLENNAYHWLALRSETNPRAVWLFVIAMFAVWFVTSLEMGHAAFDPEASFWVVRFTHGFLKFWIAIEITRRLVEDMRTNSIEFLLSTPMNERGIIAGQWSAIRTQFGGPILMAVIFETLALLKIFQSRDTSYAMPFLNAIILLPLDALALVSCGMYFSLRFRRRVRAILSSLFVVILLRVAILQAFELFVRSGPHDPLQETQWMVELALGAMINLLVIGVANHFLIYHFRRYVAERYSSK